MWLALGLGGSWGWNLGRESWGWDLRWGNELGLGRLEVGLGWTELGFRMALQLGLALGL